MSRNLSPLFCLLPFMLTGCLYSREIAQTRRDIERQYPEARFEREMVLSLGPRSLHSLGRLAGLVPEDHARQARDYLHEIHRVKVGVYRVEALPSVEGLDLPGLRRFERDGWEVAVKTKEEDEVVWVLYREHHEAVRDLYVMVLDADQLVLARVQGHLNRLFERVLQDHHELRDLVAGPAR